MTIQLQTLALEFSGVRKWLPGTNVLCARKWSKKPTNFHRIVKMEEVFQKLPLVPAEEPTERSALMSFISQKAPSGASLPGLGKVPTGVVERDP